MLFRSPRRTLQYPIVRCSTHSDGAGSDHNSSACTLGCLSFVLRHRRSTVAFLAGPQARAVEAGSRAQRALGRGAPSRQEAQRTVHADRWKVSRICAGTGAHPCHICAGTGARPCHICAGTGLTPCHICAGTGLTPFHICSETEIIPTTFEPGLDSSLPHLSRN